VLRLCAASSIPPVVPSTAELEDVEWAFPGLPVQRRLESIAYGRSAQEREIWRQLELICEEGGAGAFLRRTLEAAWRSSPGAFEYVLVRLVARLRAPQPDPVADLFEIPLAPGKTQTQWRDPADAAHRLDGLLSLMSDVPSDSKLEACAAYLSGRLPERRMVVFTVMAQTALYLDGAFNARGMSAIAISGQRPVSDRIVGDADVVLVTDGVVGALELPDEFDGVSYDLPVDPVRLELRWALLEQSSASPTMAVLRDESETDPTERKLLERLVGFDEAE
jgi:hypothetical protein